MNEVELRQALQRADAPPRDGAQPPEALAGRALRRRRHRSTVRGCLAALAVGGAAWMAMVYSWSRPPGPAADQSGRGVASAVRPADPRQLQADIIRLNQEITLRLQVEQERAGAPAGLADDLMLDLIQEAGRTRATVAWLALERGNKN